MAELLRVPTNVPEAVSTGYQRQNEYLYTLAQGHIQLLLTNMDNNDVPQVMAGSIVEVNAAVYICSSDENISGINSVSGQHYIYAESQAGNCIFKYGTTTPKWNALRGGWYHGNDRAIAKVFYDGGMYKSKVILDRYGSIYEYNMVDSFDYSNEKLVAYFDTFTITSAKEVILSQGFYSFKITGGTGGNGGNGSSNQNTLRGGAGAKGETTTGVFYIPSKTSCFLWGGYDGDNGRNSPTSSSNTQYSGAGGGASGAKAVIYLPDIGSQFIALGGSGGGGSAGDNSGGFSGGGGGGGGAGIGGNGVTANGVVAASGGNNGAGGNGGNGRTGNSRAGGSGGGSGVTVYGKPGSGEYDNGLGKPGQSGSASGGGNGGVYSTILSSDRVSSGGTNRTVTIGDKSFIISYGGGGGGIYAAFLVGYDGILGDGGSGYHTSNKRSIEIFKVG